MNTLLLLKKLIHFLTMVSAMLASTLRLFFSETVSGEKQPVLAVFSGMVRYLFGRTYVGKRQTLMLTFAAVFLLAFGSASAQGVVDLSLSKNIDISKPAISDVVTYTITVKNSGPSAATGVIVKDSLPVGGASYLGNSVVRGTGSYTPGTGMWNVGTVAAGDSAILQITATVLAQGVFFNVAEVMAADQEDIDSWPGDGALDQDDLASTCFSVPIDYLPGDEFTVAVPNGYKGIVWSYNGTPIKDSISVDGFTRARVNEDSTLTILGPGSYTFISTVGVSCPATGCCAIEIVDAPTFDLALRKTLGPGQPRTVTPGEIVTFRLYVKNEGNLIATNIALTDSLPVGLSLADGGWTANGTGTIATLNIPIAGPLAPGDSTPVDIMVMVGSNFTGTTLTNYAQIQDAKDKDGNPIKDRNSTPGNGFLNGEDDADSEPINVSPMPLGSIGDLVFYDTNNNGVLDANEPGVDGVTVELQDSLMNPIKTVVTANGGRYLFDSLESGQYFVRFIAPGDSVFVASNQGSDPAKDSNAGESGTPGKTNAITIDTSKDVADTLRNNPNIDAGIAPQCPVITLTVTPDKNICVGETVMLSATASVEGTTIRWYYAAIGGTPFVTSTSGENISLSPTSTTTYYLEATTADGCKSVRTPITVVVNAKPATPTCTGNVQNTCPETTVDLTAITISPVSIAGGVFEWRVGPSPTSALVTDPTKVAAGNYYLFEKSPAGCYSNPVVIVVNIIPCDCQLVYGVDAGADQEICATSPVSVTATITGATTGITWTTSGTGVFASATSLMTTYTPSAADIIVGNVTLTVTTNDPDENGNCLPKMDALTIVINPTPAPAFGVACDDTLLCLGKMTKLIGFAPGNTIKWYTSATGGTAIGTTPSGGKLTVTPGATTTYYAEAVSDKGCLSSERTPVTVVVKPCFSDLAVVKTVITPGPYAPGQQINYSINVTNLGIGNASSVTVTDVLPATLTYVSATPAGEYSSTTGVWTIGNMITGSNRVLVLTAKIKDNVSGSITNTAIVKSPDNDLGNTANDTSSVTIQVDNLADLMLAKKVSKVNPTTGETITYTLEVMNKGPQVATNVEVMDQLPAGLEFVSSTDFSKMGNTLRGAVASMGVGETKTLSFMAKVTGSGTIKNIAQISKSDQKDPDSTPGNGYDNGEDDEASVTVNVGCPTIEPPLIACANTNVCVGTSVTLTSVGCKDGTVKWSNDMTGASIVVTVNETATFTASCEKGECKSAESNPITIKVANPVMPVLTSNVGTVCAGGSATLTAANCTGVVMWSTGATGSPLVVTPTETTTYTAYCKKNSCVSETASITIKVGTPGPAPIVTCGKMDICPGESVTLTAHDCEGIVQWSNGATGASITVSPMATTSYTAKCVVGTCESKESELHTITVTSPTAPVIATTKETICPGGTATLTATTCEGTVSWSNGQTGTSIVVTLNATKTFTATCKTETCESGESNMLTINVVAPTAPIVSSDKTVICSGDSVTLQANGCTGIVKWSNGMTGASIKVAPNVTTNYSAVCEIDGCESGASTSLTINVNTSGAPPSIAAVKSDICVGEQVTLNASNCTGTVKWSNGAEGASIKVSPTATTTYTAICKGATGTCASGNSNPVVIKVGAPATPILTATKLTICKGDSSVLKAAACSGTIMWSTGATSASILVKPSVTTTYTAECVNGTCKSAKGEIKVDVTTTPAPTVICSTDSICKGESLTLIIQNCEGTAKWSNGVTGEAIVVSPMVTTTYTAICVVNGCESASSGEYKITVVQPVKPVLTATKSTINKGEFTTITATGCEAGSLEWSNGGGGGSITVSPTATATYTAICTVKECASDTAKITITVNDCQVAAPSISASAPTVCVGGEVILNATECAGTTVWSNGQTGTSIKVNLNTTTTFAATCKINETCMSAPSDPVTVSVTTLNAPTITASSKSICTGDSVKLSAIGCQGNVMWSNGTTGAAIYVTPAATASYTATCKLGVCESVPSASCVIKVGKPDAPTITASTTQVCFGSPVTLTAQGCEGNGYVVWSNNQVGSSITLSPFSTTTFTAQCCTSTYCKSAPSNPITVTVAPKVVKPLTQNLTNACPFKTVDLTTGVMGSPKSAGGVFVYRRGNTPESAVVADPAKAGAGTYYVFEQTTTGCYSQAAIVIVTITNCDNTTPCETNPATADAGSNATICAATTYKLAGTIGGAATSGVWTSNGTGTFSDPGSLTATYSPSLADLEKGTVTLTLTTNDPDGTGSCQAATSSVVLTLQSLPIVPSIAINGVTKTDPTTTTLTICAGDSVVLTALDQGVQAYTYKLNGGEANSSGRFVIKTSGTYSVTLMSGAQGCSSLPSAEVKVIVNDALAKPVVSNKRNICPAATVDLSTAIVGSAGAGNAYIYRIGASPASDEVASPQYVGAGTYYVFNKSNTGCVSPPAKVDVNIVNCATDTLKADVAIIKTVDKQTAFKGGEVTYSIKVKNMGPDTATNITIIDVLPDGIQYVAGAGYEIDGKVITGKIPMIAPNDSLVFSCAVKVIGTGTIVNTATITNLDQVDVNKNNNTSSVTIISTEPPVAGDTTSIGVALAVAKVEPSNDGSYLVTYKVLVKNHGTETITNVQLSDTLTKAFAAPAEFERIGWVEKSAGSALTVDNTFDGKGKSQMLDAGNSSLAVGATDTLTIYVRVKPNGSMGPYYSSVTATGQMGTKAVMDVSNSGYDTNPVGSKPTGVRFDSPDLIGIAKMAGTPQEITNGVFDVPYTIMVKNLGQNDLTMIQVEDDLSKTFGNGAVIVPGTVLVTATTGLTINPAYTGTGDNIKLLDESASTLAKGAVGDIMLLVRVDVNAATTTTFNNVALGMGMGGGGVMVMDSSTSGENPDPDNDLDPTNDSDPTPIVLNSLPGESFIGVALAVKDTASQADGSFDITYQVIVKNFGNVILTNVQLTDSLGKIFNDKTGVKKLEVGTPVASNSSNLAINPSFDGINDRELLISSNSSLLAGSSDTLTFKINVRTDGRSTPYLNWVYASAKSGEKVVTDKSTNGLSPDLNGNGDPTELTEAEPTPIVIPGGTELFIPEGFSPNNDGINDVFVIENAGGQKVRLEIYNRWMTLVYKNDNYENDWDGTANNGLQVGNKGQGLPAGTYFYMVKLENGNQFVRYMTITR